jgi:carbonic anhydrase
MYKKQIESVTDEKKRADLLCELNVIEQVQNVCSTTIVQDAWDNGQHFSVHGIIYSVHNGLLKDLIHFGPKGEIVHGPDFPEILSESE